MKIKTLTKVISIFLVIVFFSCNSFAVEDTSNSLSITEAEKVLLDKGFIKEYIERMKYEDKIELATAIVNEPEKVQISKTVVQFDELSAIETMVNTDDKELKELYKLKDEDIKETKENIKKLQDASDSELQKRFGRSNSEIRLLRKALKKNKDFKKVKKEGNIVTASGSVIGTNTLTYNMVAHNDSSAPVSYKIYSSFYWSSAPYIHWLDDNIAYAWGGNLALDDRSISSYVQYKHMGPFPKIDSYFGTPNFTENPVNAGLIAEFDQSQDHNGLAYQAQTGGISFRIYQYAKNNPAIATKILSAYAHQVLVIGLTISISKDGPEVGLSFGYGFDTSPQVRQTILY
ncbi:MAG: hypothetical protein N2645_08470 [Clostridia bacterium]|nr:hypothetical protein [Clostridia bacterium]